MKLLCHIFRCLMNRMHFSGVNVDQYSFTPSATSSSVLQHFARTNRFRSPQTHSIGLRSGLYGGILSCRIVKGINTLLELYLESIVQMTKCTICPVFFHFLDNRKKSLATQ